MTTFLRYAQVAEAEDGASAVRTRSRRWFRVAQPYEQTVAAVRALATDDDDALTEESRGLRAMLIEGQSAEPVTPRASGAPVPLAIAGEGALYDALRSAAARLGGVPGTTLSDEPLDCGAAALVLLVPAALEDPRTVRAAAALAEAGQAFLPLVSFDGRGWLGPVLGHGGPLALDDVAARLAANAEIWPGASAARACEVGVGWDEEELAWLASVVEAELARYVAGRPVLTDGHVVELDPTTLSATRHAVLPWPVATGRPAVPEGIFTADSLVDDRTGVITRTSRFQHAADVPSRLISVHAHVSRTRRKSFWQTDATTAGTSFESEDLARRAAIGEAVERYCGNIVQPELLCKSSWQRLADVGEYALDPESLVLFSDAQYAAPGFPFTRFTRDLETYWVRGRSLTRDRPAWLPACLSYGNWYRGPYQDTPAVANLFFAGLAAGPNLEFALVSALQETVERHATMVWWSNAQPLPSIREFPADLAALWAEPAVAASQRAWLVSLPNEFGIPVMAGVVENRADRLFTAGFAARSDPRQAALKAWAEALTLQDGARNLDRAQGGYRQAIARGDVPGQFIKAWRADRRYLDDYRPDFHDVVDLMCQLQIYLDPRATEHVRPWADTPAGMRIGDVPTMPDASLRGYAGAIEAQGYEIFYADLTTPDVACTGLRVVRVFVPGLVGNFSAAFPYQGKGRLRQAAVDLGWRAEPLAESDVNVFPLPHA